MTSKTVIIIGGGPSGLFCAYKLLEQGHKVKLYDQASGLGKKFLIAGNGGLNLTHSESLDKFTARYGKQQDLFRKLISNFSPSDLRSWCGDLGIATFVGSSGRVFPEELKAAQILSNWVKKLKSNDNFKLFLNHGLRDISTEKKLTFATSDGEVHVDGKIVILCMGGGSWKNTGSDGKWYELLTKLGIDLSPLKPMNCGFERSWSDYFKVNVDRLPLKNISITLGEYVVRSEMMITSFGVEGSGIYAISNYIRDAIEINGTTSIFLDLKPDLSIDEILNKLTVKQGKDSLANHLRKTLGIEKKVFILLKELLDEEVFNDNVLLANSIKNLELSLSATRPIDEAISTSGGVCFKGLTENMESIKYPGLYFAGEMLDFEAPTGGYLLQGCFSSSYAVVAGINAT